MTWLQHPDLFFTEIARAPEGVVARCREAGFTDDRLAQTAAWGWELAKQLEYLAAEHELPMLLMGGTAAQMRFSVDRQRGSHDDDFLIRASAADVDALIEALVHRLGATEPEPLFRFAHRVYRGTGKPIPMRRYDGYVPDLIGPDATGIAFKLEFHLRTDALPPGEVVTGTVFPFADPLSSQMPKLAYQIALKLMVITDEPSGGASDARQDVLPRQLNDLDGLFERMSADDVRALGADIADLAARELPSSVRPTAVWSGIRARLDEWAIGILASGQIREFVGAFSNETMTSARLSPSEWYTRIRRLSFAVSCAEGGSGSSWATAREIGLSLAGDAPRAFSRAWLQQAGISRKDLRDRRADRVWWDYLHGGGLLTDPRA